MLPAGFAPKGRSTEDPLFLSRVMMIDYDNHNHNWTVAARKKLLAAKIPGIIGIHETPKSGMRVFVFLPECTTEDFTFFENVVFEVFDGLVKFKHDEQASTLMHLTSASYDPETWIADKESLQPFPIEEELCKAQRQLYAQEFNLDENGQEQNADDSCEQLDKDEQLLREIDEVLMEAAQGSADVNHITSEQTITDLVDHFNAEIFAIAKGQRNDALVRLGSYMSYKGMDPSKMDFLISYVHNLIGCREYNPKRISQCLCWGFKHNKNHERVRSENGNMLNNIENRGEIVPFSKFGTCVALPKNAKNGSTGSVEAISPKCQSATVPPRGFFDAQNQSCPEEEEDERVSYNKVVYKSCPVLSDELYEKLPPEIKDLVYTGGGKRLRDASLLSILAVFSAAMPNLTIQVRKNKYSTNLYFLCIAPSGSGKSITEKAPILLKYIQQQYEEKNEQRELDYEKKKFAWDLENKIAMKEKREVNWDLFPSQKPVTYDFISEALTSRSKLITDISNSIHGIFLHASELNMINESLNSECGHFIAELCSINMNEPVGQNYKTDNHSFKCKFPKATILASGTPNQYVDFIGVTNNGMESRAHVLLLPGSSEWISWADANEELYDEMDEKYEKAALKVYAMFEYLEKFPTHVTIPVECKRLCDKKCSKYLNTLEKEGYLNLDALVKRLPILISRICGILCGIRKMEMGYVAQQMKATPEDTEIALEIANLLLRHTCIATTLLKKDTKQTSKITNVFKGEEIFSYLPEEFTMEQYLNISRSVTNASRRTLFRRVSDWQDDGFIVRLKKGTYRKLSDEERMEAKRLKAS